jgi:hypothetical protein
MVLPTRELALGSAYSFTVFSLPYFFLLIGEKYLSIDRNFDLPWFSLDNTFNTVPYGEEKCIP